MLDLRQQIKDIWSALLEEVDRELKARLMLGFLGSPSAGKDSLIKALFGIDTGDISPIPGSTETARVFPLLNSDSLFVLTAPGVGDARRTLTDQAHRALQELDCVVLVINAQTGVDEHLARLILELRHIPYLVALNKIDLLEKLSDIENIIAHICNVTGISRQIIFPSAADPHPALASLQDVKALTLAIYKLLEGQGKALALSRIAREQGVIADRLIHKASLAAGAVGIIPIPGPDFAPLTAIQTALLLRLARVYHVHASRNDISALLLDLLAGQAGRALFYRASDLLKGAGWTGGPLLASATAALAGSIAGAVTYSIGQAGKTFFKNGRSLDFSEAGRLFEHELQQKLSRL